MISKEYAGYQRNYKHHIISSSMDAEVKQNEGKYWARCRRDKLLDVLF